MTVKEIERELEVVERGANSNADMRHVAGLIARGVWEIARQLAKLNENTNGEMMRRALEKQ